MAPSATMTMTYTMRQRSEITSTGSLGVLRLEPSPYYREALPVKHKSETDFLRWQQSKRIKMSHKPTTTFEDLPCEIVSLILGYLPPFEVWRSRSVSRGVSHTSGLTIITVLNDRGSSQIYALAIRHLSRSSTSALGYSVISSFNPICTLSFLNYQRLY